MRTPVPPFVIGSCRARCAPRPAGAPPAVTTSPAVLVALAAAVLVLAACGGKVDPKAPFRMTLNGNPYLPGVADPVATVMELEAGFSSSSRCKIVFPLKALPQIPRPGLEISFDPAAIAVGEDLPFGAEAPEADIQVAYYPFFGSHPNEGEMLVFTPSDQGSGRIRFDDLDLEAGHVAGVLLEATLYGAYENMDGQLIPPKKPMEMQVANFPFDAPITEGPW